MKLFLQGLYLVILMLMLSQSKASDSIGNYFDPRYRGMCYIHSGLILHPGETAQYPDRDCAIVICKENSMARRQTCGIQAPPPGYKLGEPVSPYAKYPDCCQRHIVKE